MRRALLLLRHLKRVTPGPGTSGSVTPPPFPSFIPEARPLVVSPALRSGVCRTSPAARGSLPRTQLGSRTQLSGLLPSSQLSLCPGHHTPDALATRGLATPTSIAFPHNAAILAGSSFVLSFLAFLPPVSPIQALSAHPGSRNTCPSVVCSCPALLMHRPLPWMPSAQLLERVPWGSPGRSLGFVCPLGQCLVPHPDSDL